MGSGIKLAMYKSQLMVVYQCLPGRMSWDIGWGGWIGGSTPFRDFDRENSIINGLLWQDDNGGICGLSFLDVVRQIGRRMRDGRIKTVRQKQFCDLEKLFITGEAQRIYLEDL